MAFCEVESSVRAWNLLSASSTRLRASQACEAPPAPRSLNSKIGALKLHIHWGGHPGRQYELWLGKEFSDASGASAGRANGQLCDHIIFVRAQGAEKSTRWPRTAEPVLGRSLGPGVRTDGPRTLGMERAPGSGACLTWTPHP